MIDVEFNFQNDLLTNKGLIMDFSKENLRSAASTGADQLSRAHLHDAACRFAYYRVCQTNTALQAILILSQKPDRREQAPSFSPQLNQEKSVTTQEHSIRSPRLPGHDRVALHTKVLKSEFIESLCLSKFCTYLPATTFIANGTLLNIYSSWKQGIIWSYMNSYKRYYAT